MKTVLVVDDQPDVGDCLGALLESAGYQVRVAYSGEQGLTSVAEARPDAVILDIAMPSMSGYDVARILRKSYGSDLTLIAVSAWDDVRTRELVKASGFDAHLTKPAQLSDLNKLLS